MKEYSSEESTKRTIISQCFPSNLKLHANIPQKYALAQQAVELSEAAEYIDWEALRDKYDAVSRSDQTSGSSFKSGKSSSREKEDYHKDDNIGSDSSHLTDHIFGSGSAMLKSDREEISQYGDEVNGWGNTWGSKDDNLYFNSNQNDFPELDKGDVQHQTLRGQRSLKSKRRSRKDPKGKGYYGKSKSKKGKKSKAYYDDYDYAQDDYDYGPQNTVDDECEELDDDYWWADYDYLEEGYQYSSKSKKGKSKGKGKGMSKSGKSKKGKSVKGVKSGKSGKSKKSKKCVPVLPPHTAYPSRKPDKPMTLRPTQKPLTGPPRPTATPMSEPMPQPMPAPIYEPTSEPIDPEMPTSEPTAFVEYSFNKGLCPNPGSTGVPCSEGLDLRTICDKYNERGSFRDCWDACKPSFCCIHDADKVLNAFAPNCNEDQNCAQYAYCYIVWWKLHDTVGPALYLRIEQDDDFYDVPAEDIEGDQTNDPHFREVLMHHFDDTDVIIAAGTVDNEFVADVVFDDPAFWGAEDT